MLDLLFSLPLLGVIGASDGAGVPVALVPALPLFGALLIAVLRPTRVVAGGIATAMVAGAALISFASLGHFLGGHGDAPPIEAVLWRWLETGNMTVDVAFRVDALTAVMMCIITGIGALIHLYSIGYMDDKADAGSVWRFFSYLNLFVFSMLVLVMGSSFPLMFVGWEGVGLCSYLLIGFWYTNSDYAVAGKKAFVTNRVGDFFFLCGLFWLYWSLGEHATMDFARLQEVVTANPELVGGVGGVAITGICLLFFGGATGKSAQLPLYVWLPDAMAGPTPVSALIHAATMVTSGIYMICRLNFLYVLAPMALAAVAVIGALTALFAATIAITQTDIKKVLAYSTVSQLGFMFLGVGVGAFTAGFFHVMTHAFFKALMFLGSGSIIHALHHEQDMRRMGGLRKYMKLTTATFVCGWLAIIGVPGTSGFFSKDEILWLAYATPIFDDLGVWGAFLPKVLSGIGTLAAICTAFYMTRLMMMTFAGDYRGGHHDTHGAHDSHSAHDAHGHHGGGHHPHESPALIWLPLAALALLSLVGGALNLPWWAAEHGGLHHLLAPVFGANELVVPHGDPMEFVLMGVTLVAVAGAVGFAVWLYGAPGRAESLAARWPRLHRGSLNKWYVDELYEAILIHPLVVGSRQVLWAIVDAQIIDGLVNGTAAAATTLGRLHGRISDGRVQVYAITIAAGAALAVLAYALT